MAYPVAFRYQKHEYYAELQMDSTLVFGNHKKDDINVPDGREHMLALRCEGGRLSVMSWSGEKTWVEFNTIAHVPGLPEATLYVSRLSGSNGEMPLPYQGRLTCGRRGDNDIIVAIPIVSGRHFQLLLEGGKAHVEDADSSNGIYLNGRPITKAAMGNGDVLSIYTFRFVLRRGALCFENMGSALSLRAPDAAKGPAAEAKRERVAGPEMPKSLLYHQSPRTREQLPREQIILSAAPSPGPTGGGRKGNWAYLLGSGAMMAASLATGMVNPAMLLARAVGMISPIANMANMSKMNKEERAQLEEYERLRQESYQAYIADQKARIGKIADVQRRVVTAENPDPALCIERVMRLDHSLWERMAKDSDFLVARLGIGSDRLCVEVKTRADTDGFSMGDDDELEKLSERIIEETRYVDNMPVRVPLGSIQTLGIIGARDALNYELRSILVELTSAHSFRDVRLVGLFDKQDQGSWGVLRWLPHIGDETGQIHYIGFSPKDIHNVCDILNDVLRKRSQDAHGEYNKKNLQPLPHYVILVRRRELVHREAIYDYLMANDPALGVTTVFMAEDMYDLPQDCQFIVDLRGKPVAYEREKFDERLYFQQDAPVHQKQLEAYARRLAAVELEDRFAEQAVPSAITFLQGYGVDTVEELNILNRWKDSRPQESLAAPIGMMGGGKVFSLDIRSGDTSHGPHGLLAGTTGSGKSELLQSWILSMCVNYHPHDVNFVIIDYKGGGMSDLMEPLPHVVGKITNIDRNIGRSLVSLKSELKRRQRLFAEAGANNIDKYHQAWKDGRAKVRLPHLIIVTDEFAEMKKEEPEFMTELNSVATIGRSLGIHMLLATQKPAGVVNDQINSNSRFRICMKVQDVTDSREMLKRPDAARITQAGRAYVRVGEDELFEMFQSFYSGAAYTGRSDVGMQGENQVRIVGVTGNRINNVKKQKQEQKDLDDQLTAIIKHINTLCEMTRIEKMAGPWLPELEKWLPLDALGVEGAFDGQHWPAVREGLSVPIGKYDMPAMQEQGVLYMDLAAMGHFAIYGMPGSGKTTLLKTVLLGLGLYYPPEAVKITVIDAGNWSMSEMAAMPHVTDVILNQEEDKLRLFAQRLAKEMDARKKAFLKAAVNSLEAYHETVSRDLPAIVIAIEQIGPLFNQYMDLADLLELVAGSGATYGIHLIFTTNTAMGLKYKFTQMFKGAITLQMPDKSDYTTIVGAIGGVSLPFFPGRALMRGNPPVAFQTAMYMDVEGDAARSEALAVLLDKMRQAAGQTDAAAQSRAAEPERRDRAEGAAEYSVRDCLPVGLDTEDYSPVSVKLAGDTFLLTVSCADRAEARRALDAAAGMLAGREDNQLMRFDPRMTDGELQESLDALIPILNERKKSRAHKKAEGDFDSAAWLAGYTQLCLIVEDLDAFAARLSPQQMKAFGNIFTMAAGLGVVILVSATPEQLANHDPNPLVFAAAHAGAALCIGDRPCDHSAFADSGAGDRRDLVSMEGNEAALFYGGEMRVIRRNWR